MPPGCRARVRAKPHSIVPPATRLLGPLSALGGVPTKACDSGEFYTDKHVTSRPSLPARPRSAAWPDAGVSHAPALAVSLARAGVEWLPVSSDRLYSCIYRQKPHGIREASAGANPWQGAPN